MSEASPFEKGKRYCSFHLSSACTIPSWQLQYTPPQPLFRHLHSPSFWILDPCWTPSRASFKSKYSECHRLEAVLTITSFSSLDVFKLFLCSAKILQIHSIRASEVKWVESQVGERSLESGNNCCSSCRTAAWMGSWWSSEGGSTSKPAPPNGMSQISNAVYSFSRPSGRPEMEVVFIHGLQISDDKEAYWKTWVAEESDKNGNEVIWPIAWLRKEFPRTRILSLCYDSSNLKTKTTGKIDSFTVEESLVKDMVETANVGQWRNCPVVFVCHSLGGIVVKEIVIQAQRKFGKNPKYVSFLRNVRGFHFYATPHDGSKLTELASHLSKDMEKMVEKLKVINNDLGRLTDEFERIKREQYAKAWQFAVIAETLKTESHGFSVMVVERASAQHGYKRFLAVKADHFGVCKPKNKNEKSYKAFREFILDVGMEGQTLTWINPPENQE